MTAPLGPNDPCGICGQKLGHGIWCCEACFTAFQKERTKNPHLPFSFWLRENAWRVISSRESGELDDKKDRLGAALNLLASLATNRESSCLDSLPHISEVGIFSQDEVTEGDDEASDFPENSDLW